MKVLMYAYNELELLQQATEMIRYSAEYISMELYIADNGSTDGTQEWLAKQEDISYVSFDEGVIKFSEMMNQAIEVFGLEEDVLIVQPRYLLLPQSAIILERFLHMTDVEDAIVGVHSNGFYGDYYVERDTPELTVDMSEVEETDGVYFRQLGAGTGAFYLKGCVYEKVGRFDEGFYNVQECVNDYFMRALEADVYTIVPRAKVILFDTKNGESLEQWFASEDHVLIRQKWNTNYFNIVQNTGITQLVASSEKENPKVLEIGCDMGATLLAIKNRKPQAEIYGVELNEKAAGIASKFAEVYVGDIEKDFPYKHVKFDYILFGDVLEHLHDPERMLGICRQYLRYDGKIIANIPNLMHISVVADLLKGHFSYQDTGLLDKSHIHFFTYHEIVKMFGTCGFDIQTVQRFMVGITNEQQKLIDVLLTIEPEAERFMYDTYQYLVCASKSEESLSLRDKTQRTFDMLQEQKSVFFEAKCLLFEAVDAYCQDSLQVTLEMLEQLVIGAENVMAHEYVMEVARMVCIIRILCLEKKHGFMSFSEGVADSQQLLEKYQSVIYALRRIELGPEQEFAHTGIEWIVMNQISPMAIGVICQEVTFANRTKIYTDLMTFYQSVGALDISELYAQFLRAGEK